jgi:hypothetical protein
MYASAPAASARASSAGVASPLRKISGISCVRSSRRSASASQDQVGTLESRPGESAFPVGCFQNAKSDQLEAHRAEQAGRGVVVDDQDARGSRSSLCRFD